MKNKNLQELMKYSGKYKILVLSKSFYKKVNYEDYDIMEFNVEE